MSRRSISRKPRVLVDTTFLLPALGVEVEEDALKAIALFRKLEIYYLEVGVLEAVWKVLKAIPLEHLEVVKVGLNSIRNTYYTLDIPVEAYIEAYRIYNEGHKDYIDTLYYSTAKTTGTPWLTIDEEFIEFLKQHNYKIEGIIYTPEDLKSIIR
ncbi:MAG: PIN domain-containing protein [Sulfolobales archaeon]